MVNQPNKLVEGHLWSMILVDTVRKSDTVRRFVSFRNLILVEELERKMVVLLRVDPVR